MSRSERKAITVLSTAYACVDKLRKSGTAVSESVACLDTIQGVISAFPCTDNRAVLFKFSMRVVTKFENLVAEKPYSDFVYLSFAIFIIDDLYHTLKNKNKRTLVLKALESMMAVNDVLDPKQDRFIDYSRAATLTDTFYRILD